MSFFSSRRRHTRLQGDWSSDVCSSDLAMLVPETTTHDAVLNVVKQARMANLESVELFDVFRGGHVPAGQKSMAYAFTYRHAERTLTDAEVNAEQEKLVEQFKQKLQATIR